jgi:hypothetical protein
VIPLGAPPWHLRLLAWLPFLASAALVALGIQLAIERPWLGALLAFLALLALVPRLTARRRIQILLRSGNVDAVLAAWRDALERVPHRSTMQPLIVATALAAHGLTDRARQALAYAARGSAWEAAIEHRLFVEALLDAFEGERDAAVTKAEHLAELPLPPGSPFVRARVVALRSALGALTRAFARRPRRGDLGVLERAAELSPLVHWPMRYAAAVVHIDRGELERARNLLAGAPSWPEESAFRAFHAELEALLHEPASAS